MERSRGEREMSCYSSNPSGRNSGLEQWSSGGDRPTEILDIYLDRANRFRGWAECGAEDKEREESGPTIRFLA